MAFAFSFDSDLSFADVLARLNERGPWQWSERDSAWYGNLASARTSTLKLDVLESGPNELPGGSVDAGNGQRYAISVRSTATPATPAEWDVVKIFTDRTLRLCVGARMRTTLVALFALVASLSTAAHADKAADKAFTPVPAMHGEKERPFELRIVSYDGATNGALTVEVRNATKVARTFDAQGLYFVPQVSANEAPQRLGAVGALQTQQGGTWTYGENTNVAAGETVRIKLDVFCIDSHRASPTSTTPFALAKDRLPAELTTNIRGAAKKAADSVGGYAAPAAMSAVQGEVWKNRDADWIQLEGEGQQEAGK